MIAINPMGLNQVVPTREQAPMIIGLVIQSLMQDSSDVLLGDGALGPARNLDKGPSVFWGVPRFSNGIALHSVVKGGGPGSSVCRTIDSVKQMFQAQGAGLDLNLCDGDVKTVQHPLNPDYITIFVDGKVTFGTPGARNGKKADISIEGFYHKFHGSAIQFSVKEISILWS